MGAPNFLCVVLCCCSVLFFQGWALPTPPRVHSVAATNNAPSAVYVLVEYVNPLPYESIVESSTLGNGEGFLFRPKFFEKDGVKYVASIAAVTVSGVKTNKQIRVTDFHVQAPTYGYVVLVVPDRESTDSFSVDHFPPLQGSRSLPPRPIHPLRWNPISSCPRGTVHSIDFVNYLPDQTLAVSVVYTDPRTNRDFKAKKPLPVSPSSRIHIKERAWFDTVTGKNVHLCISSLVVDDGAGVFVIPTFFTTTPTDNFYLAIAGDVDKSASMSCISVTHGGDIPAVRVVCEENV